RDATRPLDVLLEGFQELRFAAGQVRLRARIGRLLRCSYHTGNLHSTAPAPTACRQTSCHQVRGCPVLVAGRGRLYGPARTSRRYPSGVQDGEADAGTAPSGAEVGR
ncbi:MAG: hypothetical protein J4F47_06580, partial [Alphaproteobacteria bacterium]|nr:hypothetical protein [Alphaproteobacteria bacterium]